MNIRAVLFIISIVILLIGAPPLLSKAIPATADSFKSLPAPGNDFYNILLTVLGVVALSYSIRGDGKQQPKDFANLSKLLKGK